MSLIAQDCGSINSLLAAHANGKCERHGCQWYDSVLISAITDMTHTQKSCIDNNNKNNKLKTTVSN